MCTLQRGKVCLIEVRGDDHYVRFGIHEEWLKLTKEKAGCLSRRFINFRALRVPLGRIRILMHSFPSP